ncbi:hypothetical protein [Brachybacterium sp. GPGPB12]|uniref:hypothetical protein n=1 Tax=Brachybacterium sp. GPGPB12 TaxID=3023517 RepID=UPI00313427F8
MTSFDAAQCLQEQGITESILIMEEVSWGGEDTTGWSLVHGPVDRETPRANGGIISATVVVAHLRDRSARRGSRPGPALGRARDDRLALTPSAPPQAAYWTAVLPPTASARFHGRTPS